MSTSTIAPVVRRPTLSQYNEIVREDIDVVVDPSVVLEDAEISTTISPSETGQNAATLPIRLNKENKRHPRPSQHNPFDYEQKYPRDAFGQERAENARVWLTCLDEAESYDRDKLNGWNDTINILLVFIGIFSAIVSTFLSQTSQSLQPNFAQISAQLLYDMVQLQIAQVTNGSIPDLSHSLPNPNSQFTPSGNASWVNGLWFSSLTLSLCTGLVAALTKQWLYYYVSPVSGTAREKVRVRQFRFEGLEKWKLTLVIDLLPVLLHLSLGLFLIGLVVFIKPLNPPTAYTIIIVSGLTYILYFVTAILPIWYPQCPYATPLTNYIGFFARMFRFRPGITAISSPQNDVSSHHRDLLMRLSLFWEDFLSTLLLRHLGRLFCFFQKTVSEQLTQVRTNVKSKFTTGNTTPDQTGRPKSFKVWRESQLKESIEMTPFLDDKALHWLSSTSSNPSVTRIIARSLSAFFSPGFRKETGLQFRLSGGVFRNARYNDVWNEDSLQDMIFNDTEFFEELCYGLYLDFIFSEHSCEYTPLVRFLSNESTSVQESVQTYYPELFNLISVVWDGATCSKTLLRGFQDKRFKNRPVVWLHLLDCANEDRELALQMLTRDSDMFNKLFVWSRPPSWKTQQKQGLGLISLEKIEQLNELIFSYLFHFFLKYRCPGEESCSFGSRYLLFITIYQNLISDEALIDDSKIREKALIQLFSAFNELIHSNHECIKKRVVTGEFLKRFQGHLLLHDSFFGDRMSLAVQTAAVKCFETFWEYRMTITGDFSRFYSTREVELQFIYRWCSKGRFSRVTFIQQLFMPVNLHSLHGLLLDDDRNNVRSNFKNCLAHLLWSVENLDSKPFKYWILHDTYVIPNIIHLFETTHPYDILFPVFYHPSVIVEAWQLVMTYPLDLENKSGIKISPLEISSRSREFFTMLQSKLHSEILKRVYDLMIVTLRGYRYKVKLMETLCRSAYIFGRRTRIIKDPNEFDLPLELIEKLHFLSARVMQEDFEHHFRKESNRIRSLPFPSFSRRNRDEHGEEEV